ncbi:hypothetical protein [Ehrlichia ruminantium]|uniref:hypothetical protein n=1 Tax=Ehrlichia ruminantium TaxID=779 RepID=UPI00004A0B4C|nr:hypothetical protein [Ehrlichia ruminantium]CAH58079.1 putative integral membrane protein [Ehrlichia ruminantium str. Welgevonden]
MIVSRNNGIKVACIVAVVSSLIIVQVLKSIGIIKDNEAEILSIVISVILITGIAAVLFQCMCTNGITLGILDSLSESDSHVADGDIDTSDIAEVCKAVDPEENCLGKDESPASTSGQNNASEGELPRVAPSQDHASQDGLPRVAPSQDHASQDGLHRVAPSQDHASQDGLHRVAPSQDHASQDGLHRVAPSQDHASQDGLPRVAPSQDHASQDGLHRVAPSQDHAFQDRLSTAPVQNDASKDGLPTAPVQNDTSKGGGLPTVPSQDDASQDDFLEGLLEPMFSENVTDVRYNEESDGNAIDQNQLLGDGKKSSDDSRDDDKSCVRPEIKNNSIPFLSVTTAVSPTGDNDPNLINLEEGEKSDEEAGQSCSPGLLYNVKLCERRHMNVLM